MKKKQRRNDAEISTEITGLKMTQLDEGSADDELLIPSWLKDRKEIIFSPRCIEKGEELGRGQYGYVYKGKLTLGKSVYVINMMKLAR